MSSESDPNIFYGGDFNLSLDYPTAGAFLIKFLKLGEDRKCLINGESGEIWTFKKILDESLKMARALHHAGVRQNDMVTIISENRFEFVAVAFGTLFLNAIIAPLSYSYTERELQHAMNISQPKFVFVSSLVSRQLVPSLEKLNYVKRVILLDDDDKIIGGKISTLKNFMHDHSKGSLDVEKYLNEPVKLFEQTGLIFMSSGTTGLPKGVEISHGNLIAVLTINHERTPMIKELLGTFTTLSITPWFHVMGFMALITASTSVEYSMAYLWKFEPDLFLSSIEKYKCVTTTVPPPVVVFLAKTPLFKKYDLSSLKLIGCGAAPLSQETEEQVKARFDGGVLILQGYGQTESSLGVLVCKAGSKPGSVGVPVNGVYAKVVDENGKTLGPNKVGELYFKGVLVMKGYINNETATRETIDKDGWLKSGDLGYYDEDGQFYIVDRLKELIKYKAYQVPPAELEALLLTHPKIKDAGVIGIPNDDAGELPLAYVVKQPGENLTENEVKEFVKKNASNAKWLRGGVKFIEEIPKNPSGKILRRQLRDLYKSLKAKFIGPFYHAMGFWQMMIAATSIEYPVVYLIKFVPEHFLETIQKYKIVTLTIPPPIVVFLAKTPLFERYDLSSLKFLMCGAAPLALETEQQLKARFKDGLIIFQGYGQTEATLGVLYGNIKSSKSGSVGHFVNGIYGKIVDENGISLGPNKVGEILVKGPLLMKGYLKNEEATKKIIDEHGWLHTGDLGYYDEEKFFYVVDRLKELIKYKAYQVPPAELEALLLIHPKIKDCGVIGIANDDAGELPFAFVVKQPNEELNEEEVKNFVKENASNAKWLRGGVKFIEEIPKNPSGKILRKNLRDLFKSLKSKL